MSLSKDLILIYNTCENLITYSFKKNGVGGMSNMIRSVLNRDELDELIKLLEVRR